MASLTPYQQELRRQVYLANGAQIPLGAAIDSAATIQLYLAGYAPNLEMISDLWRISVGMGITDEAKSRLQQHAFLDEHGAVLESFRQVVLASCSGPLEHLEFKSPFTDTRSQAMFDLVAAQRRFRVQVEDQDLADGILHGLVDSPRENISRILQDSFSDLRTRMGRADPQTPRR